MERGEQGRARPVDADRVCTTAQARRSLLERGASELVHEAYLKLVGSETPWQNRVHFYAVAATVLRHILVDHAKTNRRQKRGGDAEKIPLDEAVVISPQASSEVMSLDEALKRLALSDARKSQIVELTFFGGMTLEEIAAVLNISDKTVHRELRVAKAWLHRELRPEGTGSA
jgi:RNA polymerase sigma factor (TIGR02999 family)